MGATFRSGTSNQSTGTSLALNRPAGTTDLDILVAVFELETNVTLTQPSGWPLKGNTAFTGSAKGFLCWKRASGEPASWTWSWTGSTNAYGAVGAFPDALTTGDPFSFFSGNSGAGTTFPATNGTTVDNDELLIHAAMGGWTGAMTPSAGFTLRLEEASLVARILDNPQASAGATGSVTGSHAGGATDMVPMLVGLRPASAPSVSIAGASDRGVFLVRPLVLRGWR